MSPPEGFTLPDLPAFAELAALGRRFCVWETVIRGDTPTKVPLQKNGRWARSNDPATWCTLAEALNAFERLRAKGRRVEGIGVFLGRLPDGRYLVGGDFDLCLSPATGRFEPWARPWIDRLNTYAETSSSGAGVKALGYSTRPPVEMWEDDEEGGWFHGKEATPPGAVMPEGAAGRGHDNPEIAAYAERRFFALTGNILVGAPDRLADVTEPFAALVHEIVTTGEAPRHANGATKPNGAAPAPRPRVDAVGLAEKLRLMLEADPKLRAAWHDGAKLGPGTDLSASGRDISLALYLSPYLDDGETAEVLRRFPHGQMGSGKLKGEAAERAIGRILRKVENRRQEERAAAGEGEEAATADGRPEIRLSDAHRNRNLADEAAHLQDVIFLRDTVPVMLARAAEIGGREAADGDGAAVEVAGVRHRPGSCVFVEASAARVAWHLDARVRFARHVRREKVWLPTACPRDHAFSIVEAAPFIGFRPTAGIVHVPLLLDGGGVVATDGYDPRTGLILDLRGLRLDLPPTLDKAAAEAALGRLLRPFRGFLGPDLGDGAAGRAAVAAAALTAALRPSLPTAPAVVIDGNSPGVGKGKLARVLGAIAVGGVPAIVTEGHSDEETEKRIASAVIQGAPAILLDNLQRHVASSTLESMLTEPVANIRAFGKLVDIKVMCRSLVLLTANNASIRQDLARRRLPVRLLVPEERPELRRFDFDCVAEAMRDRAALLTAAFTIALAWLRARDLPESRAHRKPLGSFERWADTVAAAVSWLTGHHPVDLIEEAHQQDPLEADERFIVAQLVEWQEGRTCNDAGELEVRHEWSARDAAHALDTEWGAVIRLKDGKPDAPSVGKWLRARKNKVFGDYTLVNEIDRKGIAKWSLRRMRRPEPPSVKPDEPVSPSPSLPQVPGMPGIAGDVCSYAGRNGGERNGGNGAGYSRDAKLDGTTANIPGDPRQPDEADEPSRFKL